MIAILIGFLVVSVFQTIRQYVLIRTLLEYCGLDQKIARREIGNLVIAGIATGALLISILENW